MIVQSVAREGEKRDLTFTVPTAALAQSVDTLTRAKEAIGFDEIITDMNVVKVSAVVVGMRSNAGIAARMFEPLATRGIHTLDITTRALQKGKAAYRAMVV